MNFNRGKGIEIIHIRFVTSRFYVTGAEGRCRQVAPAAGIYIKKPFFFVVNSLS